MKLHDLRPAPGSHKAKRRVGRGIAAGQGKTAGRGTKGQKARAGGTIPAWFEGGQTPLHQRIPKLRGFRNLFKVEYEVVNVGDIARVAESGGFESDDAHGAKGSKKGAAPITVNQEILRNAGLIRRLDRPMKVLGGGELATALFVVADGFSASARTKIEAAGGTVSVLETPDAKRPALGVAGESATETPATDADAATATEEAPAAQTGADDAHAADAPKRGQSAKGRAETGESAQAAADEARASDEAPTVVAVSDEGKPRARKPRTAKPDADA